MYFSLKNLFSYPLFFVVCFVQAQQTDSIPRKTITIPRIAERPKIDGFLNEVAW
jgi:hypothetical protein